MQSRFKSAEIREFRRLLGAWYASNQRDLPWRRTRDPYAIWLSETMLQQTRVTAVIPHYERFLLRFPDVKTLANAPEPDLLSAWAGLGYYYRVRNLQKAARLIAEEEKFPDTHDAIRALPGVGDYTSAAVASIAFGLPHAAVDGNVLRVLSRVCADGADIGTLAGRKHFTKIAEEFLDTKHPSAFNQGMMELGATICLPKNPQCLICPAATLCRARRTCTQSQFPVKAAKQKTVEERRTLYWIERDNAILVWQRPPDSRLMPGFWELPEACQLADVVALRQMGSFRHAITFHNYTFEIAEASPPKETGECRWVRIIDLQALAISTVARKALRIIGNARMRSIAGAFGRLEQFVDGET